MRSSNKSRSRNKNSNNNRRGNTGNVVNRVFDSSGPEGRVRGTPQQIIEKYQTMARDAQLSGDRIGSENFAQHAEHYLRLLGEAQREINERREAMEAQRNANAQQNQQSQNSQQRPPQNVQQPQPQPQAKPQAAPAPSSDSPQPEISSHSSADIFPGQDDDSNLVQTPENTVKKTSKPRKPRAPKIEAQEGAEVVVEKQAPKRRKTVNRKPAKTDVAADAPMAVEPVATPVSDEPASN